MVRIGSSMAAQASERVLRIVPPRPIAPFELTDHDGETFRSDRQMRGQVSLVFFGFAHCPDICPATLRKLQQLVSSDPEFAAVRVLMISVDGERDTPATMKAFLAPIAPRVIGLTGTPGQLGEVARAFSVSYVRRPDSSADGAYTVDHSSQIYLVDRAGRLSEQFFNAPDSGMREALRAELR